jgi:predicted TIM-barrel fold metal-dependent hydrolase
LPDSTRHLVISADCHAAGRWADYERYFERRHVDAFRRWYGAADAEPAARPGAGRLFDAKFLDALDATEETERGGRAGAWDPRTRMRELDADGVAGEVIFPGAENHGVPFSGPSPSSGARVPVSAELERAGALAYDRWLADFCAENPERCAGVAVLSFRNVEAAVADAETAAQAGLRGGILLPAIWGELPPYNHPRWEPLWSACEDLGLPVNTHPLGAERELYGDLPGATAIFLSEVKWFAHRPLTLLMWSGVFERHPRLRFVLTEQMADWVPNTLEYFDDLYARPIFAQIRQGLPLAPSEYWRRQCFVGASFLSHREVEMRGAIGVDKIMWGSDYPHAEGTWPHTKQKLREAFRGVPGGEVERMLGRNAVEVYGFDAARLAPLAERIGPEVGALS